MTTPTPRTDAVIVAYDNPTERAYRLRLLAEELETGLSAAKAENARLLELSLNQSSALTWAKDETLRLTAEVERRRKVYLDVADAVAAESDSPEHLVSIARQTRADLASALARVSALTEALEDIRVTAHCIAKAGPLNTPTLDAAWSKFNTLSAMAAGAGRPLNGRAALAAPSANKERP